MSRGNRHVYRETYKIRRAFEAHSDVCEWPKGCTNPSRWYYTTIVGRWSLCDRHTPKEYRTNPIHQIADKPPVVNNEVDA